jgi:hypothetical protein
MNVMRTKIKMTRSERILIAGFDGLENLRSYLNNGPVSGSAFAALNVGAQIAELCPDCHCRALPKSNYYLVAPFMLNLP